MIGQEGLIDRAGVVIQAAGDGETRVWPEGTGFRQSMRRERDLYAFSTEEKSYQFPPPGYTARWFAVAWERQDIWDALALSVKVASIATAIATPFDFKKVPMLSASRP